MSLQKQNMSISLKSGLDTKSDPKQVVMGKMLLLENATFQSLGRIKKRNGHGVLNAALSAANAIAAYNSELVVMDGSNVYSFGQQLSDLTLKGKKVACDIAVDPIVRNTYQQTEPDSQILNGIMCFAYTDASGVVMYNLLDQVTKKVYVSGKQVGTLALKPKVNSVGQYFIISYVETGSLILKALAVHSSTFAETTVTIGTAGDFAYYDAAKVGSNLAYAYSGVGSMKLVTLSAVLVLGTALNYPSAAAQKCIFDDGAGSPYVGFASGTGINYIKVNSAFTSYTGPVTVETIAGIQNVCGISNATGPLFFYEIINTTASTSDNFVRACQMASGAGTPKDLLRSVGLWSKPFVYGSNTYLAVAHESKLQSCYFVIDSSGSVITRVAQENGGGLSKIGELREVNAQSANSFQLAYLVKDFVTSLNGDVYAQTGVNSLNLIFGGPALIQNIGNNLNISGGLVSCYDGSTVSEKNFHFYPENITAASVTSGGSLSLGQYQWVATYEWTDAKGQIHQSAQSIPVTVDHSKLNKTYISGSVTSGTSVFNIGFLDQYRFGDGWTITGPGVPANTYIFGNTNMTNVASSTASGIYTLTPGTRTYASGALGSANITILPAQQYKRMVQSSTSSNSVYFYNVYGLTVGMQLQFPSGNTVITAITGNTVTINVNAPDTLDRMFVYVNKLFTGDTTNTSNIITNVVSSFTINIGDVLTSNAFGATKYTVTAVSGSTVTVNTALTSSFVSVTFIEFFLGEPPVVGTSLTVIQSTGFTGIVRVKAVNYPTVTLDQQSVADDANDFFVTTDTYAGKLLIPNIRVTDKKAVSVAVWRTLVNQTIFYRVSSLSVPVVSSTSSDIITFADTVSDGALIGNEQLYTTGSVVDNFPPPPSSISWSFKNRSMMVPSESNKTIWYSKPAVPGVAVEFSDQFIINVPEEGGAITAGAQLDDKCVIFKRGLIFVMVGDGPTNAGAQNDYSDPQKIASDSGCINPKSIVLMPNGLMFQSEKGIYLLDRSLNVTYIGKDIEAYNTSTITSSKLIRDQNQVRFTLAGSATTLAYDYLENEWNVFTNPEVTDATIFQNTYTYIAPSGQVYQETPGVFTDNGAPILIRLKTSWLSFAGFQAFQRLYKMLLIGEYKSPHSLTLTIAYDFKSTYNQSVTIPVTSAPSLGYQFRVDFKIQKCEAIQISLSETQTAPYGEGMALSAFGLEVGAKKGLNKLPGAQSYG